MTEHDEHQHGEHSNDSPDADNPVDAGRNETPAPTEVAAAPIAPTRPPEVSMAAIVCGALVVGLGLTGVIDGTTRLIGGEGAAFGLVIAGGIILAGALANSRTASYRARR